MTAYQFWYHPLVAKEDLPGIPANIKKRIKRAIEARLLKNPELGSQPLRKSLKGFRKLRVGDYRIIFIIQNDKIIVLKIGHRKDIYEKVSLRVVK